MTWTIESLNQFYPLPESWFWVIVNGAILAMSRVSDTRRHIVTVENGELDSIIFDPKVGGEETANPPAEVALCVLLAHKGGSLRDAEYWRLRCSVTVSDVIERGVTREMAAAWMDANGFVREPQFSVPAWKSQNGHYGFFDNEDGDSIAYLCNKAGKQVGKPAQQVLDEMAAIKG